MVVLSHNDFNTHKEKNMNSPATQNIPFEYGIPRPDKRRVHKPARCKWEAVLREFKRQSLNKPPEEIPSFRISTHARPTVIATGARIGVKVETNQIDPYHCRVYLK